MKKYEEIQTIIHREYYVCDNCGRRLISYWNYFDAPDYIKKDKIHYAQKYSKVRYNKYKNIDELERKDIYDLLTPKELKEYNHENNSYDIITHKTDNRKDMKYADLCVDCYDIYSEKVDKIKEKYHELYEDGELEIIYKCGKKVGYKVVRRSYDS